MSNHPPGSPPVYEQSTAEEMYQHTKNVNAYCFAEIGVDVDNEGSYRHARKIAEKMNLSVDFADVNEIRPH